MYLKEIRAVGFKSFAEKISLSLGNGISGVVGPNGSGKSNVVDAVRWVLGEQSVKQLRGDGSMVDVIFSGSKTRKPASSASVTLIFDNTDKYLPVDYTEVSVRRTIYKTGENEYFLNNEKCRLKDVQDLFVDTGVSKESFNIISQGDIGAILSNKPEERRLVFESAANVLKYKKRKDEALRKLDRTHENITRVDDIIGELESNLEPLKKQCDAAKKYLENKKKLDEIEVSLIVSEVNTLNVEYQLNKKLVNTLTLELEELESSSAVDDSKIQELKLKHVKKTENLYDMQNKLADLSSVVESLGGKKALIVERQKYQSKDIKVHDNMVNLKENVLKKENELSALNGEISVINERLKLVSENLNKLNSDLKDASVKHDLDSKELTNHNRLENETRYKIEILKNSIDSNASLPFAVKNVLDNPKLTGVHGVIGNLFETDEEYSTAISVALSSAACFIVVDDEFVAKEAINYLKINRFGRATFFPISVIKPREIDNQTYALLRNVPDFIGVASDLVRYESTYDAIIKNQLGTTIVVNTLDAANEIARKINYRYKIVTLDGELVHVGGSLTGGASKNKTNIISEKHELSALEIKLKDLEQERSTLEQLINNQDEKFGKLLSQKNSCVEEQAALQSSIRYNLERKQEIEKVISSLKDEISDINNLLNNTLTDEENKVLDEYYEKEKEKKNLMININALKKEVSEIKDAVDQMEADVKQNNAQYYNKQQALKETEIKVNRADVRLDNLLNTLSEDYSMTFERAKANYVLEIDQTEARKIVDKCKDEIRKLGDVNVGAIEEYERVSQRYNFLNGQKEDLKKAEDTILEIIKELDEIMKERFNQTFNIVKVKFKEVFKKLFGGGDASLELTDPNNVLTTGIEIKALPPGKTLQHISLLSGGEKTLTAISLLFAILEARPVPFCILDEVEAALDEVNVDNFGKFLGEFKDKTQFIVITHKKKTMEYADVLYGITMQESGVSKLVSVKLEDIDK